MMAYGYDFEGVPAGFAAANTAFGTWFVWLRARLPRWRAANAIANTLLYSQPAVFVAVMALVDGD